MTVVPILLALLGGVVLSGDEPSVPVTLRVVEAGTGKLVPCRVSLRSADGAWSFPKVGSEGSVVRYERKAMTDPSVVEMHATVSAHPLRYDLRPGRYTLTAERGKEYQRVELPLTVGSEPLSVEVPLRRWINAADRGWFSGDTHAHRALADLPNLLLAEDLNVAFPMTDWVREAFVPPIERRDAQFRDPGPSPIRVDERHLIVPRNTEYEIFTVNKAAHTLGAFFVLAHKTPLDLGAPPFGPVAARAHREGALIELDKHNWPWSMALVPVMPVDLFELANNHVWQTTFAIRDYGERAAPYMKAERDAKGYTERGWIDFGFQNYYSLLNCGFRLRPTAGTGSGVHPVPLGFGRVYVKLDRPFAADAWLDALDAGRSFVTTGPLMFVTLDGRDPGHRFTTDEPAPRSYALRGTIGSSVPLATIEVIVNGEVAHTLTPSNQAGDQGSFISEVNADLPLDGSAWVAVRAFEKRDDGRVRFVHSGPFHVDVKDRPIRPRRVEVEYLILRVEQQIERSRSVLPPAAPTSIAGRSKSYRAALAKAR
ncbi:MAG: CehA/McbA family metallohydrolase [Isosphaeraceae bacterium]